MSAYIRQCSVRWYCTTHTATDTAFDHVEHMCSLSEQLIHLDDACVVAKPLRIDGDYSKLHAFFVWAELVQPLYTAALALTRSDWYNLLVPTSHHKCVSLDVTQSCALQWCSIVLAHCWLPECFRGMRHSCDAHCSYMLLC
jgi:hypothetical protein